MSPHHSRVALAAALLASLAGARAPLHAETPGQLDPAFGGGDGIYVFEPSATATHANVLDVAAAPDGKLFLAGSVLAGGYDNLACRIVASAGEIVCHVVPFDFGGTDNDSANAIAVGSDNKPVVAGTADGPAADPDSRAVFVRFSTGFSFDSTFDGDGKVDDIDFPFPFGATAVAVLPNGKVAWAGYIDQTSRHMLVGRLLQNGSLDTTFDGDGYRVVIFDAGGDFADEARDIAVQDDGKLVVVGYANTGAPNSSSGDFAIARLNTNGSLDTSFSGDGKVLVSFEDVDGPPDHATNVAVDRFGRIVVAGITAGKVDVARLLPDGALDPSFGGGDGKVSFSILSINDVRSEPDLLLLPGDSILIAGDFDPGGADLEDSFVAVLERDGDLDPTFGGGDGKVTYGTLPQMSDPAPSFGGAALVAGKVVVGGDGGFAESDLAFALRIWMSGLFRDDFETGDALEWSAASN
jgi:uncharacterized delta-60 repeat protein